MNNSNLQPHIIKFKTIQLDAKFELDGEPGKPLSVTLQAKPSG